MKENIQFKGVKFILIVCLLLFIPLNVFCWKPLTHVYIANAVWEDAKDGFIEIPGYGKYKINPYITNINLPFYIGGSIGPDGFPDMITGQSSIHPDNTDAWLIYLFYRAKQMNRGDIWSFFHGFLVHCASDMWAHDWVNYYAGGPFPGLSQFKRNTKKSLKNVAVHMAIENELDLMVASNNPNMYKKLDVPKDYLYKILLSVDSIPFYSGHSASVFLPSEVFYLELPSLMEKFVDLYWEKRNFPRGSGRPTNIYNREWYLDLKKGLNDWISANEAAFKEIVESNEEMPDSLKKKWSDWAYDNFISMSGPPDALAETIKFFHKINEKLEKFLPRVNLRYMFYNWLAEKYLGFSIDQFKDLFRGRFSEALLGNTYYRQAQEALESAREELGAVPNVSVWATEEGCNNWKDKVNGALYNSIIVSKMALLDYSSLETLCNKLNPPFVWGRMSFPWKFNQNIFIPRGIYSLDGSNQYKRGEFGAWFYKPMMNKNILRKDYKMPDEITPDPIQKSRIVNILHVISRIVVNIQTDGKRRSGTDADIYFGMKVGSEDIKWHLNKSNYNDFERGDHDMYVIEIKNKIYKVKDISEIYIKMEERHGVGADWRCRKIDLEINGVPVYSANVNKWFKSEGDIWRKSVNLSKAYGLY